MTMAREVVDNPERQRFELSLDGHTAFATYRLTSDTFIVPHTEVPREFEGRGIGSALVKGMLETIRARGLKIRPLCSFVTSYMRRHPEYDDLRA
jgi:predicted GNAT family acetyltransferase